MSMSPTHEHDFHHQHDGAADQRSSSLLWSLLILLLIAASAWWWLRSSDRQQPVVDAAPATPPASEVIPQPAQSKSPAMVKQPQRSASAIRNREARPLAGNALPVYPPRALRAGVEGSVVARISIDPRGQVSDATIIERKGMRDRDLDRAVLKAVRGWRFEPAIRDGRAVASTVQLPVDFKAQQ
ncbi:MAG: energy transducer TonB [Pseudomonas sp.]